MKIHTILRFILLTLSSILANQFKIKTDIEGTEYFFKVDGQLKLQAHKGDLFQLTQDSLLELVSQLGYAISYGVDDPRLQGFPVQETKDNNISWSIDDGLLSYSEELYACGTSPPYVVSIQDDVSCFPINDLQIVMNENIVALSTIINSNKLDSSESNAIFNEYYIPSNYIEEDNFKDEDIDDNVIKITNGISLLENKLVFESAVTNTPICVDKDENSVIIERDSSEQIMIQTAIPFRKIDSEKPIKVTYHSSFLDLGFGTDGTYITIAGETIALFTISDGYLQVGDDRWIRIIQIDDEETTIPEQGQMILVGTKDEATSGWSLTDDKFALNNELVEFSSCFNAEGKSIVYASQDKCSKLDNITLQNYVAKEETVLVEEKPDTIDKSVSSFKQEDIFIELESSPIIEAINASKVLSFITTEFEFHNLISVINDTIEEKVTSIYPFDCDSLTNCSVVNVRAFEMILTTIAEETMCEEYITEVEINTKFLTHKCTTKTVNSVESTATNLAVEYPTAVPAANEGNSIKFGSFGTFICVILSIIPVVITLCV